MLYTSRNLRNIRAVLFGGTRSPWEQALWI